MSVSLSVNMLSTPDPKPLDEIQPNMCMSYSHEWGMQQHFFWPRPLGGGVLCSACGAFIVPPTLKKLKGHIALGLPVRLSVKKGSQ